MLLPLLLVGSLLNAQDCTNLCRGKVDIGPAYVHVDFLQSGKTYHRMDLAAVRADLHYRVWSGIIIKPTFLYGHGKKSNELITGGIGLGFCIPLQQYLPCQWNMTLTPLVGINWGYVRTPFKKKIDFLGTVTVLELHQKFHSTSPYIGAEISWTFIPAWRLVVSYQYAWSRTHTTITARKIEAPDVKDKSKSEGCSISGMLEHDLTANWSINLGAAYNNSLSKEKHGLRGWGLKLGIAYWF